MNRSRFVTVARGDSPADLLLRNARLVNVYTGEIYAADLAIAGDTIVGLGTGYAARREVDLGGRYVCPGLIDAHVHLESSMVAPPQFARAVVPRGTTSVVSDPHEIANVCGLAGIRYVLDASEGLPLTVYANASSCVPATSMGTAGAELTAADLLTLRGHPRVPGLAEMMNFPGVYLGVPEVLAKLDAFSGCPVDGHAPGLSGPLLQAYAGTGIGSDHECTTVEEALEKLRLGIYLFIRESTAAHNLHALLPAVTDFNSRRCCLCTDDRHPGDLLDQGHLDYCVRLAVAAGLDPVTAIRMVTLNTAEWFRLYDRGALAPGKRADLVVFSSLKDFRAEQVYAGGVLVAEDGALLGEWAAPAVDESAVQGTVHVDWGALDLSIVARGSRVRVIGVVPDQVVTEHRTLDARIVDGQALADPQRDLLKIAVVERHHRSGRVGLGFVQGLGLRRGAVAGSVAHDHHNLIVAGCDDRSMAAAARAVGELGGGLVAVEGEQVLASVPLPIAGLMSDRPLETVRAQMDSLLAAVRGLGSLLHDPFMQLGFLGLEVIPALKLTDRGLVDVEQFDFVPLFV